MFQICLNLLCVWVGFMIAIYLNKYLSYRGHLQLQGQDSGKSFEPFDYI